MRSKTRKRVKIMLMLSMVCIIFTSCNPFYKKSGQLDSNSVSKNNQEGWKLDTSPITFDWYINYSWFGTKWGNNPVSKYVTQKTGVNLNFITPSGDETEKLNTMITTGKLPDIITLGYYEDGYTKVIKNKLVLPLDKLAEKYDTYFMKVADKQKLEWYRQSDGYVYGYPNFSMPLKDINNFREEKPSNQTFLVRKDIYEAIGSPDMRTPEGFLSALEKAKKLFPIVNGQALIPLGLHEFNNSGNLSLDSLLPNFLAVPWEKEGKIYDRITDSEYLKWLKTLRKANELGLLSKEVFVDRRSQMEEKIAEGRYFAMLYQRTDMATQQLKLYEDDKNKIYIPIEGPSNSNLDPPTLSGDSVSGWTVTLISKNCKDPMRAIRFLSYLISEEGNKDLYLGIRDLSFEEVNGKEQFKPEVVDLLNKDIIAFENKYGAANTYWMLLDSNLIEKWMPPEPEPLKLLEDWPRGKTYNFSVYDNLNNFGDSEESIAYSKISSQWQNILKSLLISKSNKEFDVLLNGFLTYREKEGYEKLVTYRQQKYEENKKKLNMNK
ncbi:MAG: extracellular solute-binding protein [Clostridiaceae bacterium]|nr:extracellular solute-binding protein [Clostridiaceae bacterium]